MGKCDNDGLENVTMMDSLEITAACDLKVD